MKEVTLTRGATVPADTLGTKSRTIIMAGTEKPLPVKELEDLTQWLKIRLNDTTVVVMNPR